jgi:hydrogenase-1 operon protein HyaF
MNRLSDIPVRIDNGAAMTASPASTGTIGGGVAAILMEIATRLERLADGAEADAIDLRSLPMSPDDQRRLVEALGPGEVTITLHADGESTIRETGVRGVWWSEYRDRGGERIAEFIEIARVPSILPVGADELREGAQRLRSELTGPALA